MRRPTQALVERARVFGSDKTMELGELSGNFERSSTVYEKGKVLENMFALAAPQFAPKGTKLEVQYDAASSDPPFRATEKNGAKVIFVNPNSGFFSRENKKEIFEDTLSVLIHEFSHFHQSAWFEMSNRVKEGGTKDTTPISSVNSYINPIGFNFYAPNNKPYATQPHEMQTHVIQNEIRKALND